MMREIEPKISQKRWTLREAELLACKGRGSSA